MSTPKSIRIPNMVPTTSLFTLFLGSPQSSARLDEYDRLSVLHKVTTRFKSFTLQDAKGCFRNRFEDVLLIHLATDDLHAVAELALDLRSTFAQDGVGIARAGHYLRATASTSATFRRAPASGTRSSTGCRTTSQTTGAVALWRARRSLSS